MDSQWASDNLLGAFDGTMAVAIGGLATADALRVEKVLPGWKSILWVFLGWAIVSGIAWMIAREIQFNLDGEIGWPIQWAISGEISGFVLGWQLKKGRM